MSFYVLLDLAIVAGPLLLSFDRKVAFYKRWPSTFGSIAFVVVAYGLWDAWMASRGIWAFNPAFVGAFRFIHLPVGEWLFFVVVPYACVFILACVRAYVPDKKLEIGAAPWLIAAVSAAGAAAAFVAGKAYTSTVLVSAVVAIGAGAALAPSTVRSRNFWISIAVSYAPFAIANGILTGKPVVSYDDAENLALRLGTIPVEDFVYSFSMLALAMIVFDYLEVRRASRGVSARSKRGLSDEYAQESAHGRE